MPRLTQIFAVLAISAITVPAAGQAGGPPPPGRGPGGPGGPGGPPPGQSREDPKLIELHDLNGDGWLNQPERAEARKTLAELRAGAEAEGRGDRRRRGQDREPATPGPRVSPGDVASYPDAPLYDVNTLRTIFLTFENDDWEQELQDFHGTDVEVPASVFVDGETYPGVGVRFRGASSYMFIAPTYKRSFNLKVDFIDEDQRLHGYKNLNLLNCNGDASMMSTVLYAQMADTHLAAPKANFVKVVVNGEYWGVYVNVQQFDKIFTEENFGSSKGTRWKIPGSPRGDGGLAYDGDNLDEYQARYDMQSNDGKKAWDALIELTRVLNETPLENLVDELSPLLDIDGALWFLAFDVALINSDGYWTRASDYSLFLDKDGQFHVVPHDMNEAFRPMRGRRGSPPPSHNGMGLDPLTGLDEVRKPLRSRLLAVPELRERYLGYIEQIARNMLDWNTLKLQIEQYRSLIDSAVEQDTRKLDSYEAFLQTASTDSDANNPFGPDRSLQSFIRQRSAYLLEESSSTGE